MSDLNGHGPGSPGASGPALGEQLGLGKLWEPGPHAWDWKQLRTTDGATLHVLVIYTRDGTVGLTYAGADLELLHSQIVERMPKSGIAIAREMPDRPPG